MFGPPPKRLGYPGHPEIELALVKLWRATGNPRYFDLARFFVENRGRKFFATEHNTPLDKYDGSYWQDDVPIYDHQNIKGHAVRAAYLMSGVTEVASQTGDERLLTMLDRVWRNTTERNQYITGGIGPSAHNEGFTVDYDLPNLTAYQETCATIALAQWAHRLALLYGDARYADVARARALQRRALRRVAGRHEVLLRQPPGKRRHAPSLAVVRLRLLPAERDAHARRAGRLRLRRQRRFALRQPLHPGLRPGEGRRHRRHAQGDDRLPMGRQSRAGAGAGRTSQVRPAAARARLVPERQLSQVNRRAVKAPVVERGYLVLDREWKRGDRVELDLAMPVQRVAANPQREGRPGPAGHPARADRLLPGAVRPEPSRSRRSGCRRKPSSRPRASRACSAAWSLSPARPALRPEQKWGRNLYQPAAPAGRVALKAIPYYAWDNRQPGAMKVWLPVAPPVLPGARTRSPGEGHASASPTTTASRRASTTAWNRRAAASSRAPCATGGRTKAPQEWAQYTWKKPVQVSGARVYWFDDTGRGECRLPASWRIEYLDGGDWKAVAATEPYPVAKDKWCAVRFAPVKTTALRLVVQLPPDFAAGVHEWKVDEKGG